MQTYYADKETVAEFVKDLLDNSNLVLQSITITNQGSYGEYCVRIVTVGSSDDTVKSLVQSYYDQRMNISPQSTLDG